MFGLQHSPQSSSPVPPSVHIPFVTKYQCSPVWDHRPWPHPRPLHKLPIPPVGKKSVDGTITENARKRASVLLPTCAGTRGALGNTLPKGAPRSPTELQRAHTPLRHFQFERELVNHPDKAWVSWLLRGITCGVKLGYDGPRSPIKANNLASTFKHPHIIDTELAKNALQEESWVHFPLCHFQISTAQGLVWYPKRIGNGE